MTSPLVPVSGHLFTPEQLQRVLDQTLPQLPPDKTIAIGFGVDNIGTRVALVFQRSTTSHWKASAAVAHEWSGETKVGAAVTFTK
jgi:hypothetical protein